MTEAIAAADHGRLCGLSNLAKTPIRAAVGYTAAAVETTAVPSFEQLLGARLRAAILLFALVVFAIPLCLRPVPGEGSSRGHITGTYSDQQLASVKSLTLPRVFLYDNHGVLIAQDHWPPELRGFKEHAGDAFCCVSDKPAPPGSSGPPPDCKVIVYGTEVRANFNGLLDPSGGPVSYESLPKHKYLLVEYYATWCQPCVAGRKALDTFFSSPTRFKDYLWVSIDMSRLPEVQGAARTGKKASAISSSFPIGLQ